MIDLGLAPFLALACNTVIYLAICSVPTDNVAAVVAAYGPVWFAVINGLRIADGVAGALSKGRPA